MHHSNAKCPSFLQGNNTSAVILVGTCILSIVFETAGSWRFSGVLFISYFIYCSCRFFAFFDILFRTFCTFNIFKRIYHTNTFKGMFYQVLCTNKAQPLYLQMLLSDTFHSLYFMFDDGCTYTVQCICHCQNQFT